MKPMLCEDDVEKFFKNTPQEYIVWEPKFDGVRCLATVAHHGSTMYTSRNEKVFDNFGCFDVLLFEMAQELAAKYNLLGHITFDGEVEDITGDFSTVMTQVHREHDVNTSNLRYRLFDVVCDAPLIIRKRMLGVIQDAFPQSDIVKIGDWHRYAGIAEPQTLMENFVASTGMEGIIFKDLRSYYVHKKSKFWCKSKPFETLDLKVTGKKQGAGKYKFRLGKLTVVYNGVETDVGSGFSDAQRKEFWYNPPAIIEVKFQEVLKSGKLRFPVFVKVRDDKDEVN